MTEYKFLKKKDAEVEQKLHRLEAAIERLKMDFNLFFTGELRVPPEHEREKTEKEVRKLLYEEVKSPRLSLLIQNLSSKFTTYNNVWLKKMHDVESGALIIRRKPQAFMASGYAKMEHSLDVSLNREDSFDKLYDKYSELMETGKGAAPRDELVNRLKSALISNNLVDASIKLSVDEGKVKIKIKK
jgi:hypothetical protein